MNMYYKYSTEDTKNDTLWSETEVPRENMLKGILVFLQFNMNN
jgi:hypothetical protein